jgi:hypothetical protein
VPRGRLTGELLVPAESRKPAVRWTAGFVLALVPQDQFTVNEQLAASVEPCRPLFMYFTLVLPVQ